MNWTLADYANLAQVVSVPLAVVLWYFTRDQFAKFWAKWRTLFFCLVAALALWGCWRLGWLGWLHWFGHSVTVPIWALIAGALTVAALPWAVVLFVAFLKGEEQEQAPRFNPLNFREASFFGVNWFWGYVNKRIDSPFARCPDCGCQLDLVDDYRRAYNTFGIVPSKHTCPRCGFEEPHQWDRKELVRRAYLEIDTLIRQKRKGEG